MERCHSNPDVKASLFKGSNEMIIAVANWTDAEERYPLKLTGKKQE
jgi:hypothetical protein